MKSVVLLGLSFKYFDRTIVTGTNTHFGRDLEETSVVQLTSKK